MFRLIRSTDWGALLELVSPKFFEVLPPEALRKEVGGYFARYRERERFAALLDDRRSKLAPLKIDVVGDLGDTRVQSPRAYGQRVLELYFWQIFHEPICLLDLRSTRLALVNDRLRWKPARITAAWDESFITKIRALYRSFYGGDTAGFREALQGLELEEASEIFVEHFGGDNQRSVRFELDAFQKTFHQVFQRTQSAGRRLHRNFVSLGVYLGALYENLSRFDIPFDVRDAVRQADTAHQHEV